jgi:phosphatidylglycerol:prolipoprotein diacylglycerol transferase
MRPRFVALLGELGMLVPGYAFMLAFGVLLGSLLAVDRARRAGIARADAIGALMAAYIAALLGASAVPFAQAVVAWVETGKLVAPTGIAAYGGLTGGALGGVLWLRWKKLDAWRMLDAAAPSLALGVFFARIGCFLAGCDYGAPTSSFVGTRFPAWSPAFRDHLAHGWISADAMTSLPVHPTELYEAAAGLLLFFVLREGTRLANMFEHVHASRAYSNMRGAGGRFVAFVLGYGALRSAIELLRGDASRGHLGALSTSQVFAIVTSAIVLFSFLRSRSHARVAETA